ncbi:MAG TPA: secretin N-terminal domain-containing protein, partial [Candidatus Angelobacter sp.]|nr:secretin N-terminal domain-containing protein [Candidatus Angelobacter sp.]
NKNGFAAIRSGPRTLKIMDKATAKSSNNPVKISNDPGSIPDNDEMVTQIIPIRYVEASQLVSDLSPFVSPGATIIANQAGNSIVVTDTQTNIRHLAEIIKAIDSSAEDVTEVRVFHLDYADPTDMATLLSGLFPDQNSASAPIRFGNRGGAGGGGGRFGGRGGGGGFGGGPGGFFAAALAANSGNGNPQQDRIKKRNQVVAVADARTSSVVVTATRDLMGQIEEMVTQLDKPGKKQRMTVIPVINGNATEIMQALQDTVGANTSRNTRNTQNDPFATRIQQNQNNNNTAFGGGTGNTARTRTGGF